MKKIFLFLILTLCLPLAYAQEAIIPESCKDLKSFAHEDIAACEAHTFLLRENQAMTAQIEHVTGAVESELNQLTTHSHSDTFNNLYGVVHAVSLSLLILMIIYAGYQFISADSPESKTNAKEQLKKVIILIIVWSALGFILSTSQSIADNAFVLVRAYDSQATLDVGSDTTETTYGESMDRYGELKTVSAPYVFAGRSFLVSLQARNILISALTILAPFIALLFFFIPTRSFGLFLAGLYGVELLMPMAFALMLVVGKGIIASPTFVQEAIVLTSAMILGVILHITLIAVTIRRSA